MKRKNNRFCRWSANCRSAIISGAGPKMFSPKPAGIILATDIVFVAAKGSIISIPKSTRCIMRYRAHDPTDRCEWTFSGRTKGSRRSGAPAATLNFPYVVTKWGSIFPFPKGGRSMYRSMGSKKLANRSGSKIYLLLGSATALPLGKAIPDDPVKFTDEHSADYGLDPSKRPMKGYPTRRGVTGKKLGTSLFCVRRRDGKAVPVIVRYIPINCAPPCSWPWKTLIALLPLRDLPVRVLKSPLDCFCVTRAMNGISIRPSFLN